MKNIVVVSPHPDDAEIALGASIKSWLDEGHLVTVAICTWQGDLAMKHSGAVVPFILRVEEQRQAAEMLGCDLSWLMLAPASGFDQVPQSKFVTAFDALFAGADEVYLPLPSFNDDHRRVWESGIAACRPGKIDRVSIYAYEQACSNVMTEQQQMFGRRYLPVSRDCLEAKLAAIACHQSQVGTRFMSLYGQGCKTLAELRGLEIGVDYAEMVYLVRQVG